MQEQYTILIVEDKYSWHKILTSLLERYGFSVICAFDYGDALNQLMKLNIVPILAIVDLKLPSSMPQIGYDGFQVLPMLRKRGICTIILSAYVQEVAELLSEHSEVVDVVDKIRFTSEDFEEAFMAKVRSAITRSLLNRWAEGKAPEQLMRLNSLREEQFSG